MRNVVFLVKNGIGYGHLRRALILAEALMDAGRVRPIIISQASSLDIYANTRVPVVNFPLLHRVPSAVAEDWYTDVLDKLLDHLDPAVAIEDTYPDQRYAKLPSLAGPTTPPGPAPPGPRLVRYDPHNGSLPALRPDPHHSEPRW